MSLADRLEQGGILIGCAILVALPTSALIGVFQDVVILPLEWSLVALVPGLLVGVAVLRLEWLTYGQIWRFGLTNWIAAFVLWNVFGVAQTDTEISVALACWIGAFVIGILAALTDR